MTRTISDLVIDPLHHQVDVHNLPIVQSVWRDKYRLDGESHPHDSMERVVGAVYAEDDEYAAERALHAMQQLLWLPGGRQQAGAGTGRRVTLFNCFVLGQIEDDLGAIFEHLREAALTMQQGGGIGYNFSTLRPKHAKLVRTGSFASGPTSFMDVWDSMCGTIMSAGSRRGAMMAVLDCDHPDLLEFIDAKTKAGRLTNFNISVAVSDAFMDAVRRGDYWDLWSSHPRADGQHVEEIDTPHGCRYVYSRHDAKELWNRIISTTYEYAEPGVIFIDRVNDLDPLNYCEEVHATNPCISGDTLIATADRGPVPIEQLAREGKDVLVFAVDTATGETVVRWGRNPRLTRRDVDLVEVTLDDGSYIRCTPDHNFPLRDGRKVQAADLRPGDSLFRFDSKEDAKGDIWITQRGPRNRPVMLTQHLIAELKYGCQFNWGRNRGEYNCHHLDGDHLNNDWDNLEVKLTEDHSSEHRSGDGNPMRFWWSSLTEEQRSEYRKEMSRNNSGTKNGMWGRTHSESTLQKIGVATTNRFEDDDFRQRHSAAVRRSMTPEARAKIRDSRKNLAQDFKKSCLGCGKTFTVRAQSLHTSVGRRKYCSRQCSAAAASAIASQNHKVVSVRPCGKGDVYNLSVDEFHNYAVVTSQGTTSRSGFPKASGVIICNCAEQPLPEYGCCNLGAINLARVVRNPFTADAEINVGLLRAVAEIGVRWLDNVIDVSGYPLEAQRQEEINKRRIGLGVTGLANMLQQLGVPYASTAGRDYVDDALFTITDAAYRASAQLARERGSFPLYDPEQHLEHPIFSRLSKTTMDTIKEYGLRNGVITTIAPTGTTSLKAGNVSGGVEPAYALSVKRKIRQPDGSYLEHTAEDYGVMLWRAYGEQNPGVEVAAAEGVWDTANDIDVEAHVRMQARCQEWIDSSISKTVNCPASMTLEEFKAVYDLAYDLGCKSCATYRPSDVRGQIIEEYSDDATRGSDAELNVSIADTLPGDQLLSRPRVLTGCTYKVRMPGVDAAFYVTINDHPETGSPFEIFIATKDAQYHDRLMALTRMISAVWRRGGPIDFVPEELKQIQSVHLQGWQDARRVLSLEALIGEVIEQHMQVSLSVQVPKVSDRDRDLVNSMVQWVSEPSYRDEPTKTIVRCQSCGSPNTVYREGCLACEDCGHSRCG